MERMSFSFPDDIWLDRLFKYFPLSASFHLLSTVTVYGFSFDVKHSLDTRCNLQSRVENTQKLRALRLIGLFRSDFVGMG